MRPVTRHGVCFVGVLALAVAACGGGGQPEASGGARAFAAAMAEAGNAAAAFAAAEGQARALTASSRPVAFTADDWFAWAEQSFPELFPAGPQTQTVQYLNRSYQVRYYPKQDVHLGVASDEQVYALGAFTQQQLVQYGRLVNYACVTNPTSCTNAEETSVSVWNWAGTQQCRPNDFAVRLAALRQELADKGLAVSGGQCAWTLEYATPAACGASDGRMAVFTIPRSQFPQALGQGWRPFLNGVNGDLNHPVLTPCESWPSPR